MHRVLTICIGLQVANAEADVRKLRDRLGTLDVRERMALGYADVARYRNLAEALHQWCRWANGHQVLAGTVAHILHVLGDQHSLEPAVARRSPFRSSIGQTSPVSGRGQPSADHWSASLLNWSSGCSETLPLPSFVAIPPSWSSTRLGPRLPGRLQAVRKEPAPVASGGRGSRCSRHALPQFPRNVETPLAGPIGAPHARSDDLSV